MGCFQQNKMRLLENIIGFPAIFLLAARCSFFPSLYCWYSGVLHPRPFLCQVHDSAPVTLFCILPLEVTCHPFIARSPGCVCWKHALEIQQGEFCVVEKRERLPLPSAMVAWPPVSATGSKCGTTVVAAMCQVRVLKQPASKPTKE